MTLCIPERVVRQDAVTPARNFSPMNIHVEQFSDTIHQVSFTAEWFGRISR